MSTNGHHDVPKRSSPRRLDWSELLAAQAARDSDASTELAITHSGGAQRADQGSDDGSEPEHEVLTDSLGPAATFATTEHFNLQTARAVTVSEANGRASIYLAALSSSLIALAFIGQMSRLGVAFLAFALTLLPVLAFVGLVTFIRLVQSSIEDIAYAHRIGLLRSGYLQVSPELEPTWSWRESHARRRRSATNVPRPAHGN